MHKESTANKKVFVTARSAPYRQTYIAKNTYAYMHNIELKNYGI